MGASGPLSLERWPKIIVPYSELYEEKKRKEKKKKEKRDPCCLSELGYLATYIGHIPRASIYLC
jgi:hypothetical protein